MFGRRAGRTPEAVDDVRRRRPPRRFVVVDLECSLDDLALALGQRGPDAYWTVGGPAEPFDPDVDPVGWEPTYPTATDGLEAVVEGWRTECVLVEIPDGDVCGEATG